MRENFASSQSWINKLDVLENNGVDGGRARLQPLRRFVVLTGIALCIFGAVALWRGLNPALSDEQTIARQVEEMRVGIEKRSAGKVTQYISDECTWNGLDGKSLRAAIGQAMMQWRDVRLTFDDKAVVVTGDEAAAAGEYTLTVRETAGAKPETFKGNYGLQWKKRNGKWMVTHATGGQNLPGIGNAEDAGDIAL